MLRSTRKTMPLNTSTFLTANPTNKKDNAPPPDETQSWSNISKLAFLECLASILFCYAAMLATSNPLANSACIFTVVMTLRDQYYFFPDSTPFVTVILATATLYTDADDKTKWWEIAFRVGGQLIGWAVVMVLSRVHQIPGFEITHTEMHIIGEILITAIECIGIAFATIPLVGAYNPDKTKKAAALVYDEQHANIADSNVPQSIVEANPPKYTHSNTSSNVLQSKAEANPPKYTHLIIVAFSLSVLHYTLEQAFAPSMGSPLLTILMFHVDRNAALNILSQFIGLALACFYVWVSKPSAETVKKLVKT